ncbi:hypothetical protein ACLKA7_003626 [Drosophila subpalustris]
MNDDFALFAPEEPQPTKIKNVEVKIIQLLSWPKKVRYSTIREGRKAVEGFFRYLVFLALATFVTQTTCDYNMYFYTKMWDQQLASRKTVIDPGFISVFNDIHSYQQIWDFIQFTFLPLLDRGDFRMNDSASIYKLTNETKQFIEIFGSVHNRTILHGNVLLGPPRVRQIRVKKGQCQHHPVFSKYLPECYSHYTWMSEDHEEYNGIKWQSMSDIWTTPLWGNIEIYLGAGYMISFSYDNEENILLIKKLREDNWINHGTRLFLLEFSLYHVDTRLFQLVKLMVENPPTFGCIPMIKLRTIRRESFFNNPSWTMGLVTFAFYLLIFINSCREVYLINAMGFCNYIRVLINLADFLCCLLAYLLLFLNFAQFIIIEGVMRHVKKSDQYISLDMCWEINIVYNNIAGLVIFIAWIRLLHFIVLNRTIAIFVNMLHKSKKEITGVLLILFAVFMAYAQCGMTLFGGNDPQFRNLLTSILTMMRWTVGNTQNDKMPNFSQSITWIYYVSYVIFVHIMLLFSFQAIMINIYDEVKQVAMTRPSQLGTVIALFLRNICDKFCLLICVKRRQRSPVDLDAKGEYESDKRIDPRQAAAIAAMRLMEHKNPTNVSQPDYLPVRLERAAKRVKELEEVTSQALKRITEYYNILQKHYNISEMRVNDTESVDETVI